MANDIHRLYQLPLGDFTTARNALAKSAGAKGAGIKALEKPSAPAWAVNQLYWRERRSYDALIRASDRVRAAHAQLLRGKKLDLGTLEAQHSAAVKTAADLVRGILTSAGDAATPATMKAVVDTLQALPGGGEPGMLTKALAPIGFGAFGALMGGAVSARALADVVTFAPPKPKADEVAEAARRAEAAADQRRKAIDAELKTLTAENAAARKALDRAEAERGKIEQALADATETVRRRRSEATAVDLRIKTLERERADLTKR